jgi:ABC-type iron transport system FetAB ATPase subunit
MSLSRTLDIRLPSSILDRAFLALDVYTAVLLHDIELGQRIWCGGVFDISGRDIETSYRQLAAIPRIPMLDELTSVPRAR